MAEAGFDEGLSSYHDEICEKQSSCQHAHRDYEEHVGLLPTFVALVAHSFARLPRSITGGFFGGFG